MSARKKAPVNLLMCPFELYMFIGVSMQLRVVFKYDFLVLIPYCPLKKKKKKKAVLGYEDRKQFRESEAALRSCKH